MKGHSIKVQPIAEPVWLGLRFVLSPPFVKRRIYMKRILRGNT